MSLKREWVIRITGAMVLPALWAASVDSAIAAPPRTATVTRIGPAGNTSTRQSAVTTNGHGGYTASSTFTGPAGNNATRQTSGSYDPATRTYSRSSTTTGPNGAQWSSNASVHATGNGVARTATHTGPSGDSVTSTGQTTYNPVTGTATQSRVATGPNGQSATESRTVTVAPAQSSNN